MSSLALAAPMNASPLPMRPPRLRTIFLHFQGRRHGEKVMNTSGSRLADRDTADAGVCGAQTTDNREIKQRMLALIKDQTRKRMEKVQVDKNRRDLVRLNFASQTVRSPGQRNLRGSPLKILVATCVEDDSADGEMRM